MFLWMAVRQMEWKTGKIPVQSGATESIQNWILDGTGFMIPLSIILCQTVMVRDGIRLDMVTPVWGRIHWTRQKIITRITTEIYCRITDMHAGPRGITGLPERI